MKHFSEHKIDLNAVVSPPYNESAGGVVCFLGTVRNHNQGKNVFYLEYEAYIPMADKMINELLDKAMEKWELQSASCVHRVGKVEIGGIAVVIVTASKHRKEAYEANQYIIHQLKHKVPIWKKEFYEDGSYKWGNNCDCAHEDEELVTYI